MSSECLGDATIYFVVGSVEENRGDVGDLEVVEELSTLGLLQALDHLPPFGCDVNISSEFDVRDCHLYE